MDDDLRPESAAEQRTEDVFGFNRTGKGSDAVTLILRIRVIVPVF